MAKIPLIFLLVLILNIDTSNSNAIKLDKTYLINLDKSKDRLKHANYLLQSEGIRFERFSAIEGVKLKILDLQQNKYYTGQDIKDGNLIMQKGNSYKIECIKDFSFIYKSTPNRNNLSAGELGIFCSHATIWHNMLKNNFNYTLQFEDSIDRYNKSKDYYAKNTITDKIRRYIWKLTRKHKNNIDTEKIKQSIDSVLDNNLDICDVIHLSYFYLPPKFHKNFFTRPFQAYKTLREMNQDGNENDYIERLFFLDNRDFGGMWSYIMTKKGAKKILENINENNGLAIDTLLMKMAMENKIVLCGVKTNLFTRGDFQSSYNIMKN